MGSPSGRSDGKSTPSVGELTPSAGELIPSAWAPVVKRLNKGLFASSRDGSKSDCGRHEKLSVHIPVKALADTVHEAFKTKEIVQRDLLIVVPVFVTATGKYPRP